MRSILSFIVGFIFLSQTAWANDLQVIAVEYPPYTTSKSPSGGLSFDRLNSFITSKGLPIQVDALILPPGRLQLCQERGEWCAAFYPPPENQHENVRLIELGEKVLLGLYRLKEETPFTWQHLEDLKGKHVAIMRQDKNSRFNQALLEAGIHLMSVESNMNSFRLVLNGRADYAFGDNLSLESTPLSSDDKARLQFSETKLMEVNIGMFINSECPEIAPFLPYATNTSEYWTLRPE
ncbi:hypothetical protein GCM10017044_01200 [Kordiimonas sediminis]|uniref:Solute-binding protein family 3/N-terminal domain-containing protein n=1 Tax=Kordiimonas sediminis TaxID=1735581 RepID=A0A919AJ93_9PROT|nr:transporter substrate-binding domain-containing protein [Kordiimonas sediminis]GHF11232.1 hypothetical protein GCM10017044_01200 [Kordiimonas sediminis]